MPFLMGTLRLWLLAIGCFFWIASVCGIDDSTKGVVPEDSTSRDLTANSTAVVPTEEEIAAALKAFLQLPREELTWKTWDFSTDGELEIDMQEAELPVPFMGGSVKTRVFGELPGMILRVKPGGTMKFTLKNKLGPGTGKSTCGGPSGSYESPNMTCQSNTTNIHMHGLHASPSGHEDNVFATVAPGESRAYAIHIPEFHMGGTHFYHPHVHHSTAVQAGGGAHGMLIVDDPVGSLPKVIEDMPEIPLMMTLIQPILLMRMEQFGLSSDGSEMASQKMWVNSLYPDWRWGNMPIWLALNEPIWFTVNGQYRPLVSIEEGKWYRLRIAKASIDWHTRVFEESNDCEFQLLAKDGIYLHEAVRPIHTIHLASGARADVAVRCSIPESATETPHLSKLLWSSYEQRVKKLTYLNNKTGELLSFSITPRPTEEHDEALEVFSVRRPCYLADLRNAPAEDLELNRHTIDMVTNITNDEPYPVWPWLTGTMEMYIDDILRIWGHHTPEPVFTVPVGELMQINISGLHNHNFHGHVNPFQIQSMDAEDPWYQVGDWQDTMYPFIADKFVMRQNIDYYTGRAVIHCHLLAHEDNGMMAYYNITGEQDARYPAKEKLDPTCYEGAYPVDEESTTTETRTSTLTEFEASPIEHEDGYEYDAAELRVSRNGFLLSLSWSTMALINSAKPFAV